MSRWCTGWVVWLLLVLPAAAHAKIKVAAIGASTTAGSGSTAGHSYPDELARLLGPEYEVKNFGVGGTTLLRKGRPSYWGTKEFKDALAYQPEVAFFWFGGNDAKAENWAPYKGEFLGDYVSMIQMFQGLPSRPRTFVSVSCLMKDTGQIRKAVVDNEIGPLVRQAGAQTGSVVIDLRSQFENHPEYFQADGIHPNNMGTLAIAKYVYGVFLASSVDAGVADSGVDAGVATDAASISVDAATVAVDVATPPAPKDSGSTAPRPHADAAASSPDPGPDPSSPSTTTSCWCAVGVGGAGATPNPLLVLLASWLLGAAWRRRGRRARAIRAGSLRG